MNKQLIALLLVSVLVIIFIPLPFNEDIDTYERLGDINEFKDWKFVTVQEGQGSKYEGYPKYSVEKSNYGCYMHVISGKGSLSYIETIFVVPDRGTILSYERLYSTQGTYIELYDSQGVRHGIKQLPSKTTGTTMYDISQFAGEKVTIRMYQSSDLGFSHWYYQNIVVMNEPYSLWDNFNIFKNILISALLVSTLIGFLIGVSGLEFFSRSVNRIQMYIHENKTSGMGFENEYIKRFLEMSFSVLDAPICVADKIGNVRVRNWIKITSVLFLSFTIIYITYILAYIFVMVILALITLAIIIWIIISLLGGSPSGGSIGGGGGSSSGSGDGKSSSSSGSIFGNSYEETAKEEPRPFKVDKRTRSSEGALPFGLGGDTIYTTEYEDTSTDETVKGHGWTRSEADFNARKNLKNK
jgi:hypothetical protein